MSTLLLPSGVTPAQLDTALEVCERIAARDRSSLYLTSQFFEDRSRYHAFIAMYAVMRLIDDLIDSVPDKARLSVEQLAGRMSRDCAFILSLIIRVYSDLLRRIEAAPDALLRGDPRPARLEKAVLEAVARRTGYPLSRVLEKAGPGLEAGRGAGDDVAKRVRPVGTP